MKRKILILVAIIFVVSGTAAVILIVCSQEGGLFGKGQEKNIAKPIEIEIPKEEPEPEPEPTPPEEPAPQQATENPASESSSGNIQEIQSRLEQLVSTEYNAGGNIAICTGKVDGNDLATVNNAPMQAASLIKLYVAGCVYENYDKVTAYDSYGGETENLMRSMITVSDNSACNTLVTRLGDGVAGNGMALVNQYCSTHGFSDTHMGRLMLEPNDVDDNYTSVRDCCNFLKMINASQLEGSATILSYMNQQERRGKIPAGLPSGVSSGNKTGELSDVENDAAIVYGNGGTYVLCVMSQKLSDPYSARQFIIRTSSVVYEMMQ